LRPFNKSIKDKSQNNGLPAVCFKLRPVYGRPWSYKLSLHDGRLMPSTHMRSAWVKLVLYILE